MASFKHRAEKAEDETTESRKSLNEMIETLRQERAEKASATALDKKTDRESSNGLAEQSLTSDDTLTDSKTKTPSMQGFDPITSQNKDMDAAVTAFATQQHHRYNYVEEVSPYASMFGVVLLGVGLMAYLNGWQKMDK